VHAVTATCRDVAVNAPATWYAMLGSNCTSHNGRLEVRVPAAMRLHVLGSPDPPPAVDLRSWARSPAPTHYSLRVLNAGLGTTATHFTHTLFCDLGMRAVHHEQSCNLPMGSQQRVLSVFRRYNRLRDCIASPHHCSNVMQWKQQFARDVLWLISRHGGGVEALSDVPYANIFRELLVLIPTLQVLHTVREPFEWATQRLTEHEGVDVVCRTPFVATAYSIGECLDSAKNMRDALESEIAATAKWTRLSPPDSLRRVFTRENNLSYIAPPPDQPLISRMWHAHGLYAARFAAYNAFVARIVPAGQYSSLCAWDSPTIFSSRVRAGAVPTAPALTIAAPRPPSSATQSRARHSFVVVGGPAQALERELRNVTGGKVVHWPEVNTAGCPGELTFDADLRSWLNASGQRWRAGKSRGIALSHWTLWRLFARQRWADALVVFEADARLASAAASTRLRARLQRPHEHRDLTYLGWCHWGARTGEGTRGATRCSDPPGCTHAYVLTLAGAAKAADALDICGPAVDWQLVKMCRDGTLSWGLADKCSLQSHGSRGSLRQEGLLRQSAPPSDFRH